MTSGGDGQDKEQNPWGQQPEHSNVIPMEESRRRKKTPPPPPQKPEKSSGPSEPMINLPPYTKYMLAVIVLIHLIVTFALSEDQTNWVYGHLGFTPGRYTGVLPFEPIVLLTPFSHIFLHGSWLHLAMNSVMLVAFGSGIEKWMGGKKMIAFFIGCCLFGVLTHFILNFHSVFPMIGASGGLSGLFAAALIMLSHKFGSMTGKYGMWPLIIIWIAISVGFGMLGAPGGGQIAWAAHVGGFIGGFILLKWMKLNPKI